MTIEKAIEELKIYYDKGVKSPYVKDPVAWALYQTWRVADADRWRGIKHDGQIYEK